MDRTSVIKQMYQGYLDAHDLLVAGTKPSAIPELAAFSARMDDARIQRVTIPRADFERALGHPLPPGAVPVCDRCLSECVGVTHPVS